MFAFLTKLLLVARSRLKSWASLEAENLVLRQQVIVFKPQVPLPSAAPEYRPADLRLAVPILPVDSKFNRHSQAGDSDPLAPARLPSLLALEVSPARRTSED